MKQILLTIYKHILLLTFALLLGGIVNVYGATYYSRATGNWNDHAIWSLTSGGVAVNNGVFPIAGDNVIIEGNRNVTLNVNTSCINLTISSGSTLTPSTHSLTINGNLINSGTIGVFTGTLSFSSGATYEHSQNGGLIPNATWDPASTCLITGYTNTTGNPPNYATMFSQVFGNFTWNCTGQTAGSLITLGGALSTIKGNLTILSTGNGNLQLANSVAVSTTVSGNFVQSGGTFILANTSNTVNLNVAGNFSISNGNLQEGVGAGNINFNGTATQVFSKTGGIISGTINFAILNNAIVDFGTSVLNGTGPVFNLNAGGSIITSHAQGLSTMANTGSIQVDGTKTYNTNANYTYNGTVAQVTGNGLPSVVNNLTISNSAGVTIDAVKTITNNLSITSGSVANLQAFTHTAGSLMLGGVGTVSGSWGSTSSTATNKNNTYFAATTGIVNVGTSTCTTPTAPTIGTIIQPTCTVATGSFPLNGLPALGMWTLTRNPDGVITTGTGITTAISGLSAGTYSYTVANGNNSFPCPGNGNGLAAEYFNNITLTGAVALTRTDATVNFDWGNGNPGNPINSDNFSARWTGLILPCYTENYTFTTNSDDGIRLWVNGTLVIDNWTVHAATLNTGTINLTAGQKYTIVLEFYENGGQAVAQLSWNSASRAIQIIPTSQLFTSAATACTSVSSANVVINAQPATPTAPTVGTITQPTCILATGSVFLSGLPATGTWTLTRTPGAVASTGTGLSTTISGLASGPYTYTVTNAAGCISPASANVFISAQPITAINSQSTGGQTVCIGGTLTAISITTTGVTGYQWYSNTAASIIGAASLGSGNGAQTNSYTPQSVTAGTLYYYCIVTGPCGPINSAFSGAFIVNSNLPVSVSIATSANNVCSGTSVTFTATPTNGGTPVYQWKVNNINAGTNSSTYAYSPLNGDAVTCELTSNATCATGNPANSNTITMTVSSQIGNNIVDNINGAHGTLYATVAEHETAVMTAPIGSIFTNVIFASYGMPTGISPTFTLGSCHALTSQSVAETNLLGQNTASILAENSIFGDPCNGTIKKLFILATYTEPICTGNTPGVITGGLPTGGNGTYTYFWESSVTGPSSGFAAASGVSTLQNYTPGVLTQNTWYRRTVTSGACSNVSTVLLIKVNPVIAANTIGAVQTICSGSVPSSLTGSLPTGGSGTFIYSWESSITNATTGFALASGTNNSQNYTPDVLTQTIWYRRTVSSGGCSNTSTANQITVTPLPFATFSYTATPYCSNASNPSPTFSGGGVAGSFSSTAGLVFVSASTGQVNIGTSTAGTYTVTNTIAAAGGCAIVTSTSSLSITTLPIATVTYVGLPFCKSLTTAQSVTLTGTTGGAYSASPSGLTIDGLTGAVSPSTSTAGGYTVTYTLAAANGCGIVTATAPVTITAIPTATISYSGTPFCKSVVTAQPVTLTGTGAYTGGTYSSTTGLIINSGTGAITPSTSTAGTYTVTYNTPVSGGCAAVPATTSITITTLPAATISYSGTPFCMSLATAQSVTMTGTIGGIYTASPASLTINSSTGAIIPSTSTAGAYTVTYTMAATGGCSAQTATTSVIITTLSAATISYAGSPFCMSLATAQSVTMTGTIGGIYTASPASLTINSSTGAIIPSTSTAGAYTVTYAMAATGGCSAQTATASVTITTLPAATISYGGSPFCKNFSVAQAVTMTGTAGGSYSVSPLNGLSINAGTGAITPSTGTAGIYTVTYTIAATGGCTAQTATASVTITTLPTATISYSGSPFCNSLATAQPVTLSGTGAYTGGTYSSTAGLSINSSGAITPSTSTAGTYTVTYTIPASGGCVAVPVTTTVTITTLPVATFSYAGTPYCSNATNPSPTFSGLGVAGTFTSTTGLVFVSAATGQVNLSGSTAGTYTVTNTIAAAGGCSAVTSASSITINLSPQVSILIVPSTNSICSGTSVTFTATSTNGGTTPAYQWQLNGINVGTNNIAYTSSALVKSDAVTCILTSNATCATGNPAISNTVTMTVNPTPSDPTAIAVAPASIGLGASEPIVLSVSGGGGVGTLKWYSGSCGSGTLIGNGSPLSIAHPSVTTTYYARWETATCYSNCLNTTITITPNSLMYRSKTSGNWNVATTWESSANNGGTWSNATATPTNTDGSIAILNGHTVTVTANVTVDECTIILGGQVTINTGQTVTIANGAAVTDFSVDGSIVNAGTIVPTGALSFNSSSSYTHTRDGGAIPVATWNATSTCDVTGMTGTSVSGLNQTFGNFIWDCSGQAGNTLATEGDIIVKGNFTLSNGTFSLSNGLARNLTIAGSYIQTGGLFDFNIGTDPAYLTKMYVAGNFTNTSTNGGNMTTSGAGAHNGEVIFNGNGVQTILFSNPKAAIWVSYTINVSSSVQLLSNIELMGDASGAQYYANFIVNGTLDAGLKLITDGTNQTNATSFVFNAGATLITAHTEGISLTGATGNIQLNGPRNYNTVANYIYNGTSAQVTGNGLVGANNLTIDNIAGVTMDQSVIVNGALNFTNGLLTTGLNTITVTASGSINNANSLKYVNGKLARNYSGIGSLNFPIGKGGNYRPLSLAYTALTGTSTVTAQQFETAITGTLPVNTILFADRYWDISESGGSAYTYSITLDGTGFSPDGEPVLLKDPSPLTDYIAIPSGVNYTASGLTSVGKFALASKCQPPTIDSQPTSTAKCIGESVTFGVTASGPGSISYQWRKDGATINLATNSSYTINPVTLGDAASYDVMITRSCGSSILSGSAVLRVNPTPAVTAMTSSICSAGSFTVTPENTINGIVPTGTTYSWSAPSVTGGLTGGVSSSTASSITGTIVNPTNISQTATYTVTPTSGSCTGSTFTVIVTVSPKPSVTNMTSTICSAGSFTVTPVNTTNGIVPVGTTYSWPAPVATGITGLATGANATNISGTLTNTTNAPINVVYTVTPLSGSCTGSAFTVTVTVNPTPTVNNLPLTQTICQGIANTLVTLTSNVTGATFAWTATATAGVTGFTASGTSTIPVQTISTTGTTQGTVTYVITPTASGCAGTVTNYTVLVNPIPSAPTVGTITHPTCAIVTGSVVLNGLPSGTWTINPGAITGTVTSTTISSLVTGTYNFTVTNASGCTSAMSSNVVINAPLPSPTIIGTLPASRCGAGTITLGATASAGVINWYAGLSGGSLLTTGNTYTIPNLSASTTYYVDATYAGCTSSPRVAVQASIITPPTITATGGGTFCTGSTVNLSSTSTNITNQYWTGPNNYYSLLQNPVLSNVTSSMTGTYTVTGSALSGINLVSNGNFEAGNTGFTSNYTLSDKTSTGLVPAGSYDVLAYPSSEHGSFCSCDDHTPGAGTLQMAINGAGTETVIWSQSVNVNPSTPYQFTYWVQTIVNGNDASPSKLQLFVNGSNAGPVYTANATTGTWTQFTYNWTSGPGINSAILALKNENFTGSGNDFALDDIVFQQACETTSSVIVTVNAAVTAGTIGSGQSICSGATPASLTSLTPGTGSGTISYEWQTNASGSYVTIGAATLATYSPPTLIATTSYQRRTVSLSGGVTCNSQYTTAIVIAVTPASVSVAGAAFSTCSSSEAVNITAGSTAANNTGVTWTSSGTGIFTNANSLTTATYSPSAADIAAGSVTLILTATGNSPCGNAVSTKVLTITPDGSWIGILDTDWNNKYNWACNQLPTITSNVLIANGKTYYPILSSGEIGTANNLTIENNASVTVTGNTLQIAGLISNSGIFTASAGTIEMKGSAAQTIGANVFTGNTIKDLTVNNSAGATLQGALNITGIVKASIGTLYSGTGNLTLLSTSTQTALIDGAGTGQVLGTVNMQRYLPSAFGYKYFSSPFQLATVNEFATEVDLSGLIFPNFYKYDEDNHRDSSLVTVYQSGWVNYITQGNSLLPLAGYAANIGPDPLAAAMTANIAGVVNNGSLQTNLYNHHRKYTKGFSLVGNPYPSPIDWTAPGWIKTNIDNALYFFNASGTQYAGNYTSYVNGIPSGNATNEIAAMQGFFVHVTDGAYPVSGTLGVSNSVRINNLTPVFKNAVIDNRVILRFTANFETKNPLADAAVIYFDQTANLQFDRDLDALKMTNTDIQVPNLYTLTPETVQLSINGMPMPTDSLSSIPLGITTFMDGWINLKTMDLSQLPDELYIYLVDAETSQQRDLKRLPDYRFFLKAGEYNHRFTYVFSLSELNKTIAGTGKLFTLSRSGDYLHVKANLVANTKGSLLVTNLLGQTIIRREVTGNDTVEINQNVSTGVYVITLIAGKMTYSEKIIMRTNYE